MEFLTGWNFEDAVAESRTQNVTPTIHENQGLSNLQLKEAWLLLVKLRPTAARLNQMHVMHHVDRALVHIHIGLLTSLYTFGVF